jgi:rhodanese-related sulfurtransferase
MSSVTDTPTAPSHIAITHFEAELQFETDCWDVHHAISSGNQDFVVLDVRSAELFEKGHIPGAIHLPHGKIIRSKLADFSPDTIFVTYCTGPHCNGATRGAIRLANLGFAVKKMTGGILGWEYEGFPLEVGSSKVSL